MKRIIALLLAVIMIAAMALIVGCSGGETVKPDNQNNQNNGQDADNNGGSAAKGEVKTSGNISVLVPEGWNLQPGQNNDENSCFVMKGSSMSDGYVWITIADQGLADNSIAANKSTEISPFTVEGIEWAGKDTCFCGTVGDRLYLITLYALTHDDANVQNILASLKGA